MTIFQDMLFKPTPREVRLRGELTKARDHAEELEDALLVPNPDEFTNPKVHVEICFERQRAAHAWRKAAALQSELNGAENGRYSRSNLVWMLVGFGILLFKDGATLSTLSALVKLIAGV